MIYEVGTRRFDPELRERYLFLLKTGRRLFTGTNLVGDRPLHCQDLHAIDAYHVLTDPTMPPSLYRLDGYDPKLPPEQLLHDWSTYDSWHKPGGFAEHRELVKKGIFVIADMVKTHLRPVDEHTMPWQRQMIEQMHSLNIWFVAAGAYLHDEGRQLTHMLPTNDFIAQLLLKQMGIRPDIPALFPDMSIFEKDELAMMEHLASRGVAALLVEIADNFCKRAHDVQGIHLDRLMIPTDYQPDQRRWWVESYTQHEFSGRPSEQWMRNRIEGYVLKGYSYILAIDQILQSIATISLADVVRELHYDLLPTIPKVNEV